MAAVFNLTGDHAITAGQTFVRTRQIKDSETATFVDLTPYTGAGNGLRAEFRVLRASSSAVLITVDDVGTSGGSDANSKTKVSVSGSPTDGAIRLALSEQHTSALQNADGTLVSGFYTVEGFTSGGFEERLLEGSFSVNPTAVIN